MKIRSYFTVLLLAMIPMVTIAQSPSRFQVTDNMLELPSKISFKAGTTVFAAGSTESLQYVRDYLKANPSVTLLRIEGHVSGENTQALSERRALAVAKWLRQHGVNCKRLIAVGFGNTQPAFERTSPGEASGNTRIEIENAAVNGQLVGGAPADGGGKSAGNPCR